jgi:hypothetical protein
MIHVPRHHNIELIAEYRTVAESLFSVSAAWYDVMQPTTHR